MAKLKERERLSSYHFFTSSNSALIEQLLAHLNEVGRAPLVTVFTPNPEQLVLAAKRSDFHRTLTQASYLLPDGMGVVWASRVLGWRGRMKPVRERISGVDVVQALLTQEAGDKILVIGGRYHSSVSEGKLKLGHSLVHWIEGFQNIHQPTESEQKLLTQTLKKLKPKLVFVAFGAPLQEEFVAQTRELLTESGVRVAMVVGGSFDVLLGKVKRAPKIIQRLGLEWLFRLVQEPWRWRRQLQLVNFLGLVGKNFLA